jgi:hypothetical protein
MGEENFVLDNAGSDAIFCDYLVVASVACETVLEYRKIYRGERLQQFV